MAGLPVYCPRWYHSYSHPGEGGGGDFSPEGGGGDFSPGEVFPRDNRSSGNIAHFTSGPPGGKTRHLREGCLQDLLHPKIPSSSRSSGWNCQKYFVLRKVHLKRASYKRRCDRDDSKPDCTFKEACL